MKIKHRRRNKMFFFFSQNKIQCDGATILGGKTKITIAMGWRRGRGEKRDARAAARLGCRWFNESSGKLTHGVLFIYTKMAPHHHPPRRPAGGKWTGCCAHTKTWNDVSRRKQTNFGANQLARRLICIADNLCIHLAYWTIVLQPERHQHVN